MKCLADESVDIPVYLYLKEKGYSINHISFLKSGIDDKDVLQFAFTQRRILITVDKDFGDLAFLSKKPSYGIILYRLSGLTNKEKSITIETAIKEHVSNLPGNFIVISKKQVRIRKLIR